MTINEWLTIQEAAAYIKVTAQTIRNYIREKKLPSYRYGKIIRIKRSDIDDLLKP